LSGASHPPSLSNARYLVLTYPFSWLPRCGCGSKCTIPEVFIKHIDYATESTVTFVFNQGVTEMGDKGSKDKGKKEKQKKAQRSPKEKRKLQKEKKNK
jgi:hypothetical protein